MKRLSTLLLIGLVLPACAPSAEWGPGLMHWSDRNPKMTHPMSAAAVTNTTEATKATEATENVDNAMVGTATESDVMQESDATEDSSTDADTE